MVEGMSVVVIVMLYLMSIMICSRIAPVFKSSFVLISII